MTLITNEQVAVPHSLYQIEKEAQRGRGRRYVDDVRKIHMYLTQRGILRQMFNETLKI